MLALNGLRAVVSDNRSDISRILRTLLVFAVFLLPSAHALSSDRINQKPFKQSDKSEIQYFIETLRNETKDYGGYEEIVYYDEPGVVPELPMIKLFEDDTLEVGKELTAGCVSKYGDPPAEIFWYLDGETLESALEFEEVDDTRIDLSSVISIIQRNLTAKDSGRSLVCQAWHPGYPENYSEVKHKLTFNFKPVELPTQFLLDMPIGEDVDVSISFRSNPKPSSLIWLVGDRKIYYGAKTSKYISREISSAGKNFWNASLRVANLTHEDTLLNYTLQVRNFLGGTEYHIRLGENAANDEVSTTEPEVESTTPFDDEDDELTTMEEEFPPPFETTTAMGAEAPDEELSTPLSENSTPLLGQRDVNRIENRTKVSRVMIFKRPILTKTTTESMVTISRAEDMESNFSLKALQAGFIEIVASAIIFWKTSLMILLIIVLIVSLSYYRRRIVRLKAEIIQKNLGSSYSQSCSYPNSSNAYTPTYFPRRCEKLSGQLDSIYSDYDSSSRSRSIAYANTYNVSDHSYESIDGHSNEHIYAEIPFRKDSDSSTVDCGKPNNYENNSASKHLDYDHLDYSQSLTTPNIPHRYHALLMRGNEARQLEVSSLEIESTYI